MRRESPPHLIVVRENGPKAEVPVDATEYKKVLKHCRTKKGSDSPYSGTDSNGQPYHLMLGASTLAIRFRGPRLIREGARPKRLTMKVVHEKGGETSFPVTENEYARVLTHFAVNHEKGVSDAPYYGTDSEGYEYCIMLGNETFSVSATPLDDD